MKRSFNFAKKIGRKNLILSVVALILTVIMVVGSTYSWIENITAIQITNTPQNGTGTNTANLGIARDISKTIKLGKGRANGTKPLVEKVDLGAYFNESGDTHLTTCSGNGESFMFKSLKGSANAKPWRIGTEDDENVNYLSATFKIYSENADVDMWFNAEPSVTSENNPEINNIARYSITVDGETNVYSKSGDTYEHIVKIGTENVEKDDVTARKTSDYTYGNTDNNVLFRVGTTEKEVTIRIWLQNTGTDESYTDLKTDINMVLVSTWAKSRTITIRDCTSDCDSEYWMSSRHSPKLYVALASDPKTYYWEIKWDNTKHLGTVEIPSYYYAGDSIYVIRCSDKGWDDGNANCHGINCWNYWETELPSGFEDLVFNVVGNTPIVMENGSQKQNDTGYCFWGEAEQITVKDNTDKLNYDNNVVRMLVHDIDNDYYYPLHPDFGTKTWRAYIPKTSDKIEFWYHTNGYYENAINSIHWTKENPGPCYKKTGCTSSWGYTGTTPQTRPYNDRTYNLWSTTEGSWLNEKTNYRLAGSFNGGAWNEDITFYKENQSDNISYAYVTLKPDTLHQIKVKNGSTYYTNGGVMCRSNSTGWTMGTNGDSMGFISGETKGTYEFRLDTSGDNPKLSARYPGNGDARRVYLVTDRTEGTDKYAYMWNSATDEKNDEYPGQIMTHLGKIGSKHIYLLKYNAGFTPTNVKFSGWDNNKTDKIWESGDNEFDSTIGYQIYYETKSN